MSTPLVVFHRGALGDSVMLWPWLRAAAARRPAVTLVTDREKAALAASVLGIHGADAERREFNALWREGAEITPTAPVGEVIAFHRSGVWEHNALRMFPEAALRAIDARATRPLIDQLTREEGGPVPLPRVDHPGGPLVVHVGAGSPAKSWPIDRWPGVVASLRTRAINAPWRFIAGEVEAERFTRDDRAAFDTLGGRYLATLDDLRRAITPARAFAGNDSGPTHLAAQLGVPTLAIFGPTDPTLWAPCGPAVRVLAAGGPIDGLGGDGVARALTELLAIG
ncbi:MAG: glycosyltransferase family 9 protein [Phycisphaeraceae bacterium]|nr:MAG: glycosyltransferase family 9 protein [Phycisphaeraceae bacterium]